MIRQSGPAAYQIAPGAITATGATTAFVLPWTDWDAFVINLTAAAVTGTSPTGDFYLQTMGPDGNWYDVYHFTQVTTTVATTAPLWALLSITTARAIAAVGSKTISANALGVPPLTNQFRIAYTIGGTTPSITPIFNILGIEANRDGF